MPAETPRGTGAAPIPAVLFEPDGYVLTGPKLMGRQAAGNSFFRAVVDGLAGGTFWAYSPHRRSAEVCAALARDLDPQAKVGWLRPDRHDILQQLGGLFLPGPGLGDAAATRLRSGPAAWSITGITHTLASHTAMGGIAGMLAAPVMPWDALICTSTAARSAVTALLDEQAAYLRWRFGTDRIVKPELPIIPLGVHAADFTPDAAGRAAARQGLALQDDEVAALFAGRLSFHAKAHPFAMFVGLQAAAERSGRKVALLLCGQFPNDATRDAFLNAAQAYAPRLRIIVVNGKDFAAYGAAWAASDLFISLSDNIQETFGITPVEAMAAGLPVVVTDWDGYRDTILDGETGFRIPCWMPAPGNGDELAATHEDGLIDYDRYIGLACLEVPVDLRILTDRLTALVSDPGLRARMGAAGRARVMAEYDWQVVFRHYRALWTELAAIRTRLGKEWMAQLQAAPPRSPARQDPYKVFAGFASHTIGPETRVRPGEPVAPWPQLRADPLFRFAGDFMPSAAEVELLLAALGSASDGWKTVADLAQRLGWPPSRAEAAVVRLAKAGVLMLQNPT